MHNLIEQFLEHLRYERNVSSHTLRNYSSDLEQFLNFLTADGKRKAPEVSQIDHLTIREWLAVLHTAQKRKSSIARKLAALRTFFQFLVREGKLESNPAKLVSTPRLEKKLPQHLSIEEAIRFIEAPDPETDMGKRDRAMLELMYATGVRVAELTTLNIGDIDFRNQLIRVTGKRRKQRIVPFGEPAAVAIRNYLTIRETFLAMLRFQNVTRRRCFLITRERGSRRAQLAEWSRSTSRSAPACTILAHTPCAIRSLLICWTAVPTCVTFRSSWDTRDYPQHRSTLTFQWKN